MRFETRLLADLHPAEYNPRVPLKPADPEYQSIKRSIEEFGYADPIVINSDGTIIKGHQRRTVMMDMGYLEADVIVLDIQDKAKEKALNIALNKITGKWDNAILKDLLLELDLEGYDFSVTGFHRDDLEDLIQLVDIPAEATDDCFDPDAAAAEIVEPVSRIGDIWQLGRHRLMCGDSTDPDDVAVLMGGEKLDLVITDPPYNVDYGAKTEFLEAYLGQEGTRQNSTIQNDHMDNLSFYQFLLAAFQNMNEAMRTGAAIYVFHAESTGLQFRQAYADAGLKLAQCLIWEKNAFVLGRQDYQWRHEPILYGWKEGAAHYFVNDRTQDTVLLEDVPEFKSMKRQELLAFVEKIFRDYRDQQTVHFENKPTRNALHPTMKPVPLIGRLMNNSSKPGWLVGDFFGGSGSTLMAAEQLGRTAYIMEMDERNVDVIVHRWEQYTGRSAVKLT
jgi:DNA modification methylase